MMNKSIRTCKSLLLGLSLGLFALGGLSGCAEDDTDTGSQSTVRNVLVTSDTIAQLAPGEMLTLDIADQNVVFHIDFSKAPVDFSRILLTLEDGSERLLTDSMNYAETRDYGGRPQPELLAAADKRFQVASNPDNFGVLDDVELSELETYGYIFKQAPGSAAPAPAGIDDCIHAECVICNPGWDEVPGNVARDYIHIQHVWCD